EHDRKLLADVKRHGWHVIGVEEDQEGPAFAYSIGLYRSFRHPEVIVFGLAVPALHRIINAVGEQIRGGERFGHPEEAGAVPEGHDVAFRAVGRRHYADYLGHARWFFQGDDFPALQCVWPDSGHRYPWHPEFNAALARLAALDVLILAGCWPGRPAAGPAL